MRICSSIPYYQPLSTSEGDDGKPAATETAEAPLESMQAFKDGLSKVSQITFVVPFWEPL